MTRNIKRLVLMGALLSPATLYALGLGEIHLNSALNQPFDAEIDLLSATPEELAGLKVAIASNDTFSRYGLDRPSFLGTFALQVDNSSGRSIIKVTSSRPVTEPFVTLLVEANWARGRLIREYTVLLDPPVFMPGDNHAPAVVAAPRAGSQPSGVIERPRESASTPAATPRAAEPSSAPAAPAYAGGETYRVQRNDTLYKIASSIHPGSHSEVNQTMWALYTANTAAFAGNINRLREGAVLRVPPMDAISSVNAHEASSEIARQYGSWRTASNGEGAAEEGGRLRLVTPQESGAPNGATAKATPNAGSTAETQALQQRVTSLESQLAESKRLLDLKNTEMAQLQKRVSGKEAPAPAPEIAKTPPVQTQPPAPAVTPTPVATPEAAPAEPAAEAPPQAAPEAVQPKPAPKPPRPVVVPAPEPEPSMLDRLGDYWLLISALGIALITALIFYFRRRSEAQFEGGAETMTASDFEARGGFGGGARLRNAPEPDVFDEPEPEPEPEPVVNTSFANDDYEEPEPVARAATPRPAAKPIEETFSSDTAVRLDQQDALAEADFHMAYGLYDQAADLVKIAIGREPERRDLKLKLLEIYFVWGNKDLFVDTARDLYATRDTAPVGEWDKILIMGKQISPEDPMFKGDVTSARSADLVDVNLEGGENQVDIDLYAAPEGAESSPLDLDLATNSGVNRTPATGKEASLDFLLDEPNRGADDEPTREMDPTARTQETPTIESPAVDPSSQTIREQFSVEAFERDVPGADQTAELSLDDLGLDVANLEHTGRLEDTDSLADTGTVDDGTPYGFEPTAERERPLADDELTRIAEPQHIQNLEKTVETPRPDADKTMLAPHMDKLDEIIDTESTGTIYLDDADFPAENRSKYDVDATASFKVTQKLDMDLDRLGEFSPAEEGDTVKRTARAQGEDDRFSEDVFGASNGGAPGRTVDLDVGHPLEAEDRAPTATEIMADALELPELEPVTMSEVGTKLDLARAYMDMGDPDGARSILEEVLGEGNPGQKQEAQRLLDSIR